MFGIFRKKLGSDKNDELPSQVSNDDYGSNTLFLVENGVKRRVNTYSIPGLYFEIKGSNNTVSIELPIKFSESCLCIVSDFFKLFI